MMDARTEKFGAISHIVPNRILYRGLPQFMESVEKNNYRYLTLGILKAL
jgi:hypothetical protein